jgi:Fe-S-cluster containining protein
VNDAVAVITINTTENTIESVEILQKKGYRFKCKRCANLCCKLGGPPLTEQDVKRLVTAGYIAEQFLEHVNTNIPNTVGVLKSGIDGRCIFLEFSPDTNQYGCGIYTFRPTLCRVYPFKFEKSEQNKVLVKIIPCCLGLNTPDAGFIDTEFMKKYLFEPLRDAVKLL